MSGAISNNNSGKWIYITLFGLLLLMHLYPIWSVGYFHTQDGPVTIYNTRIIIELITGDSGGLYHDYYQINAMPSPNWLASFLLALALKFFDSATTNKLLLSIYILSLPCSFHYFLTKIKSDSRFTSILVFPLLYSYFLFFGFYNFLLSLSVLFWLTGYFITVGNRYSRKAIVGISLLIFLLYMTHVVSYVIGLISITLITVSFHQAWPASFSSINRTLIHKLISAIKPVFFMALPTLLFFIVYLANSHRSVGLHSESIWDHVKYLLGFQVLMTFTDMEAWLSVIYGTIIIGALAVTIFIARKARLLDLNKNYIIPIFLVSILIFILAPNQLGGGSILKYRIPVYIYLFLIAVVAQLNTSQYVQIFYVSATVLIAITFLVIRTPIINKMDADITNYMKGGKILPENVTALPITLNRNGYLINGDTLSPKLNIYKNIGSYLGHDKPVVVMDNYQARTTYFPVEWKEELNPFIHISANRSPIYKDGNIEAHPPCADFADYSSRTSGNVDYVVVWGDPEPFSSIPCQISSNEQLSLSYEVIYDQPEINIYQDKNLQLH